MKKISKIILENFRVFSGKKEINFNNSQNKPADFICIYGKNGFGKTSLFDGFEWFFTGELELLKKDLKSNVLKYNGNILKYKYAKDEEKAGVGINYSDGDKGYRTIVKRSNSANDYGKGSATGICRDIMDKKQILPHSKIDSFVYATKPSEMYKEWGNFWDPENKQREIFELVYNVYKDNRDKTKIYRKDLQEIKNELEELNIAVLVEINNNYIKQYNDYKLKGFPDLDYVDYCEDKKILIDNNRFKEIGINLYDSIQTNDFILKQCEFLIEHFDEYQKFLELEDRIIIRKDKWKSIIEKCSKKEKYIQYLEELKKSKKECIEQKNKISQNFDKLWFDVYEDYIDKKNRLEIYSQKLNSCYIDKKKICSYIENFESIIDRCNQKKNNITFKSKKWVNLLKELEKEEKLLLKEESLDILIKKKKNIDKQKENYQTELNLLNFACIEGYDKFIEKLALDEKNQYKWIGEWEAGINDFKEKLKIADLNEKKLRKKYKSMEEEVNELDNLLVLAKKEIEKSNTCICPICKNKFENSKQLLSKIDMSSQQTALLIIKKEWISSYEYLKKIEENYRFYNEQIKAALKDEDNALRLQIAKCDEEILKCKNKYNRIKESFQSIDEAKEDLKQNIGQVLETKIESLSSESLNRMCSEDLFLINKKLVETENKMEEQQKNIENLNIEIENKECEIDKIKKDIEGFWGNPFNMRKKKIMEQRQIFSYDDWERLIFEYDNELKKIEKEENKIENILKYYKIYYSDNIEKYRSILEKQVITYDKWIVTYKQYKETLFEKKMISKKSIIKYQNRVIKNKELGQKKYEIWNRMVWNEFEYINIKNYNFLIDQKSKLQNKIIFSEKKEQIAKQLYDKVKKQLDEHIKNVFGGITISQIYSKIEPHKRFTHLQYKVSFSEDSLPELYIKVINSKNEEIMPELFFSSAQLNTVALSVFLGGALCAESPNVNTIFIDDPIGHFDDLNVLSFVDVLRTIISNTDWQIFISTHEERFYEIMKVKLNPQYYNSKFLKFKEEGIIVEDTEWQE